MSDEDFVRDERDDRWVMSNGYFDEGTDLDAAMRALQELSRGASPFDQPFHICPACGVMIETPDCSEVAAAAMDSADGRHASLACPACSYMFVSNWPI